MRRWPAENEGFTSIAVGARQILRAINEEQTACSSDISAENTMALGDGKAALSERHFPITR